MTSRQILTWLSLLIAAAALPTMAVAQLGLPNVPAARVDGALGQIRGLLDPVFDQLPERQLADALRRARLDRLEDFVRDNAAFVEFDGERDPAVRGVLVVVDMTQEQIAIAQSAGFRLIETETIGGLDMGFARFSVPDGQNLKRAQKRLEKLLPDAVIDADNIYFKGGTMRSDAAATNIGQAATGRGIKIGLIDGGVAANRSLSNAIQQKGFARDAPRPSDHGTAVAALMVGHSSPKGVAPDARLMVADVYGSDPAGGNATAIARALGWLTAQGVSVINISLTGPDNVLLHRAIERAQGKGVLIVAASGNDGPAAPPSYPAAQRAVIAVTAVDGKLRALPEAQRGKHIVFAAPGAEMASLSASGRLEAVRGTSFAAPLVAARLAQYYPEADISNITPALRALIATAKDLGKKGRDPVYGHGLICEGCGTAQ